MKPLISIIVPAYKKEYIKECVDSIIGQSYDRWQLVVVNDNSPYDIDAVMQEYDDDRISYRKRTEGFGSRRLVDNWNDCLKDVAGQYVINMGDDDVLLPGCLDEYVRLIEMYPDVDVFHGWTEVIDEHSRVTDIYSQHPRYESVYGFMQRIMNGENLYIGDLLIRTDKLRAIGGYQDFPYAWHSDHITAYAAAHDGGVVSTERVVFGYRKHGKTISMSKDNVMPKLHADMEAYIWYADFLSGIKDNDTDSTICKCLLAAMPYMREKKICQDISEGCKHKPWKTLSYIPFILHHDIGRRAIIRAIAYSI